MIGYPLDSKVEYDSEGKPTYDRAITSKPLRKLYSKLFSTGVMPNPSNNFQVIAGDAGMTVKVNPGFAVVQGCLKLEETTRTIEIQAASSSLDRIDTVVLRLNDEVNARICDLYVRQGIPASSPTRPDLVRSGSVYEIGLADIFIPANTATIVQKRITDTRLDPDRCGYVSSISKFDTETLYLQIQNDLADFKLNEQAEFLEWFEYIKVQLSEDVAGNLQNQIGVLLNLKTEIKTDLVNAINWLKENIDTLNSNLTLLNKYEGGLLDGQDKEIYFSPGDYFEITVIGLSTRMCKIIGQFRSDGTPDYWVAKPSESIIQVSGNTNRISIGNPSGAGGVDIYSKKFKM